MNFDLIDDINQQQTNLDAGYQNVSLEESRHDEQGFVSSIESGSVPQGQFEVDPSVALSASSSDPKLFFPALVKEMPNNIDSAIVHMFLKSETDFKYSNSSP